MYRSPEFDNLRAQYEYGDMTVIDLCSKHGYLITELEEYIELHNWEVVSEPDPDDPEAVNKFYSDARKKLTIKVVKRAMLLWENITTIEDGIIEKAKAVIDTLNSNANMCTDSVGLELTRLTKVISTLQASSQMYNEAVLVPAFKDKELKKFVEDTLESMESLMKLMRDKGIPVPEIDIPDIVTSSKSSL